MSAAFKIERFLSPEDSVQTGSSAGNEEHHKEIMASLNGLRDLLGKGDANIGAAVNEELDMRLKNDIEEKQLELLRMKEEMRAIYLAIDDTKRQILTIKESGTEGQEISRAAEELSAIIKGTEEATNNILQSAELIETNSSNLMAALEDKSQQALACEMQESVVTIFENCNFQDLTGQRITKVVKTFCFIEQRILAMMDIWGGADAFLDVTAEELDARQGDKGLLNGPSLEEDKNTASQDDIDALFD